MYGIPVLVLAHETSQNSSPPPMVAALLFDPWYTTLVNIIVLQCTVVSPASSVHWVQLDFNQILLNLDVRALALLHFYVLSCISVSFSFYCLFLLTLLACSCRLVPVLNCSALYFASLVALVGTAGWRVVLPAAVQISGEAFPRTSHALHIVLAGYFPDSTCAEGRLRPA